MRQLIVGNQLCPAGAVTIFMYAFISSYFARKATHVIKQTSDISQQAEEGSQKRVTKKGKSTLPSAAFPSISTHRAAGRTKCQAHLKVLRASLLRTFRNLLL